ncbi:hypothetical protein ABBQ38_004877 [Trebouxia sp. C0009 RCD-2024]
MPSSTRKQPARSAKANASQPPMRLVAQEQTGGATSAAAEDTVGTDGSSTTARKKVETMGRSGQKSRYRGPHSGSSRHRGVTQHKRTKKWEAHLWDERHQVYLGGFDCEEDAARAHDVMALKCRGKQSTTNYDRKDYEELLPQLEKLSKDNVRQLLMRKACTSGRSSSKLRGITKHNLAPRRKPPLASSRLRLRPSITPPHSQTTPQPCLHPPQSGQHRASWGQARTRKHSPGGLLGSEAEAGEAYDMAPVEELRLDAPSSFGVSDCTVLNHSGLDGFATSGDLDLNQNLNQDFDPDFDDGISDIDRLSAASCQDHAPGSDQCTNGLLDFPSPPAVPLAYPKQTLGSFPSPLHDTFSFPFSIVYSLDPHMGASNPTPITHLGRPHLSQTLHTPYFDPDSLTVGPSVHSNGLTIPLSKRGRAFKWRSVGSEPSNDTHLNQSYSARERTSVPAFSPAQGNSACKWPHSTCLAAELVAGDMHATQTQTWTQCDTQIQSRTYLDGMTAAHSHIADPASRQAADMQRMLHNSDPVHSPEALQHRLESIGSPPSHSPYTPVHYADWHRQPQELQHPLESTGSPVEKYTDRHRQGPLHTATAASLENAQGLDRLGAKLADYGFGPCTGAVAGEEGLVPAGRAVAPGEGGLVLAGRAVAAGLLPAVRAVPEEPLSAGRAAANLPRLSWDCAYPSPGRIGLGQELSFQVWLILLPGHSITEAETSAYQWQAHQTAALGTRRLPDPTRALGPRSPQCSLRQVCPPTSTIYI